MIEIAAGQPLPPADLQPLIEVELVDRERDKNRGENREITELINEGIPVLILQRIIKAGVPAISR
jgi:hypothetical protein